MLSRIRIHVALLLLALAMLLAFVSLDVLFSWRHHESKQLAESEAALRAEALRLKSIVETELGSNPQFAERMLVQLATLPDIQLAAVIDDHGNVLMSTRFEARGRRATEVIAGLDQTDLQNALSTSTPLISVIDASHLGVLLSFGHMSSGDDAIGHNDGVIVLRSDLARQRRDLRTELLGEIETKTVLGLLFLLVFGGLLQSWIVGPVSALDAAAESVAGGERGAMIPAGGLQEIDRLSRALVAMRDHLIQALDEVSDLNRNLESIVVERTEAMRAALAVAESASKAKAAFLASMSHEIRTPMSAIIGLSQLSLGLPLEPTVRNYTGKVLRSAEHLLGVINDILDFSRIEAGKIQLEHTEFELRNCIDNAMTFVVARASAKRLDLRVFVAPGVPRRLVGDPLRLSQILTNLLNNAVKFTESGHVHLTVKEGLAEVDRRWLRFEVEDSGIGIAPEALPNLFAPFEQVDSSISRRYGGSGLGLAISKQLAERMDGRIGVRSEPGQGSLFFVEIPFGRAQSAEPALGGQAVLEFVDSAAGMRSRHVFVVGTDDDTRSAVRDLIQPHCAGVEEAASSAAAIVRLQGAKAPFHFLLLHQLRRSGETDELLSVVAGLRAQPGHWPLVVSLLEPDDAEAAVVADPRIDLTIARPESASALLAILYGLLQGHVGLPPGSAISVSMPSPASAPRLAGVRILVAEDNEINQELAVSLLQQTGAEFRVVGNGEEAVRAVREGGFDAVLMDVQMPLVDGIEATQRIRGLQGLRQPLIIAVTANALSGDRERCLQAGMDHYLSKPIYAAELFRLLSSLSRDLGETGADAAPDPDGRLRSCFDHLRAAGVEVDAAIDRMMGNQELYLKLARRFVSERKSWCGEFQAAVAAGDSPAAAAMAHSAKSLAGLLGLGVLQAQLGRFEADATGGGAGKELMQTIVRGFEEALALYSTALQTVSEAANGGMPEGQR